ncbi:MAG: PD40 domain-containing protein [Bacteroidales bacterium]|nr:PD40 domain-containing protein [Bacteroidales bacterium]MBN2755885.1 PD40 domain-containing protein [Bacteroidales bacterium]
MRKIFTLFLILIFSIESNSQTNPLWMRYPSISPDGKTIAFSYKGNIFTVSSSGGEAKAITIHPAYDYKPVWSSDGKNIAFASERYGNFDIYVISSNGGQAKRLTFHSGNEYPTSFSPDNKYILFSALVMDNDKSAQFPDTRFTELYQVSVEDGQISQILTTPAIDAKYNKSKTELIYHDYKGYEDNWRKHHISPVARDIWMYSNNKQIKLTAFKGEDREPVYSSDEQSIYYLSEQFGSFNVCKLSKQNPNEIKQITFHKSHPVRSLSISKDEKLCYSYNGEIFIKKENSNPEKVNININYEDETNNFELINSSSRASEMDISPDGNEIAFIYRGEVFVSSVKYSTTKQITNSPEQERTVSFSPDGKSIIYASERNGSWNIYKSNLIQNNEKSFTYSTVLKETPLIESIKEEFQPKFSPDGKEIAYLEERTTLKILNLETNKTRVVFDGTNKYSYADGDQKFEWSPNGKWLLFSSENNLFLSDIFLIDASGKKVPINLSKSGYNDTNPKWGMNGEMIIWTSDKEAMRKQAVWWGSQSDVYAMFFSKQAFEQFKLSEEDFNLLDETRYKYNDSDFDIENSFNRKIKLTESSLVITDHIITKDGSKLFYLSRTPKGYDLWMKQLRENQTSLAVSFPNSGNNRSLWKNKSDGTKIYSDELNGNIYVFIRGQIYKVSINDYKKTSVNYDVEMQIDKIGEREYLFEHVWRQVKKKFYTKSLHNLDWDFYKTEYHKFLPYINNGFDFSEMLSEMLGELNGSHTGCRYYPDSKGADETARLGLFYNYSSKDNIFEVTEVIENGPFDVKNSQVEKGIIIEKINNEKITSTNVIYQLLNHKTNKLTLVSFFNTKTKKRWDETIKPISIREEQELLYSRWLKQRREETEKLSNGRIGYVHVRDMSDESLREVYSDIFGLNKDKDAIIIDTRFNGGGWLHDDLANLLNGEIYLNFNIRGIKFGHEPMSKWTKESIVLMSEDNYSDANGFPYTYKKLGIGKLVGTPVAGTMTAVWWEALLGNDMVFGIPQVGTQNLEGEFLENKVLEPDYLIVNEYSILSQGRDEQIEKAVELLLNKK